LEAKQPTESEIRTELRDLEAAIRDLGRRRSELSIQMGDGGRARDRALRHLQHLKRFAGDDAGKCECCS
jgi:hypothetical protein